MHAYCILHIVIEVDGVHSNITTIHAIDSSMTLVSVVRHQL